MLDHCFAGPTLGRRLQFARKHGYSGIELWHEDLLDVGERSADDNDDTPVKGHQFHVPGQPRRMSWSPNYKLFYQRTSDANPGAPQELARRGVESWERRRADMSIAADDQWEPVSDAYGVFAAARQRYSRL